MFKFKKLYIPAFILSIIMITSVFSMTASAAKDMRSIAMVS